MRSHYCRTGTEVDPVMAVAEFQSWTRLKRSDALYQAEVTCTSWGGFRLARLSYVTRNVCNLMFEMCEKMC